MSSTGPEDDGTERPNVIWDFGDQRRAQALGCAGDPNLHTPNLDRLASEGMRCPSIPRFRRSPRLNDVGYRTAWVADTGDRFTLPEL